MLIFFVQVCDKTGTENKGTHLRSKKYPSSFWRVRIRVRVRVIVHAQVSNQVAYPYRIIRQVKSQMFQLTCHVISLQSSNLPNDLRILGSHRVENNLLTGHTMTIVYLLKFK